MKIEKSLSVPTSVDELWDLLMDIPRVGSCFPGVVQVTSLDDGRYQGNMRIRVGPVSLNLAGTISLIEQDWERLRASLRVEGSDRRLGASVNGTVSMELTQLSPRETELAIVTDVSFLGKLGELGQPVLRRKVDSVVQGFAKNLLREVTSP